MTVKKIDNVSTNKLMRRQPYPWNNAFLRDSPFKRADTSLTDALANAKRALRRYKAGESIGYTRIASLKSMGKIPRTHGQYELGPKYVAILTTKKS